MSALAMILTAAMVVPGDGPEKVSGEIAKTQQLDMSGEWEGTWENSKWRVPVNFCDGVLRILPRRHGIEIPCAFTDMGNGKVMMRHDGPIYRGVYRIEHDRIVFHFKPVTFKSETSIIILHPVKSRKQLPITSPR